MWRSRRFFRLFRHFRRPARNEKADASPSGEYRPKKKKERKKEKTIQSFFKIKKFVVGDRVVRIEKILVSSTLCQQLSVNSFHFFINIISFFIALPSYSFILIFDIFKLMMYSLYMNTSNTLIKLKASCAFFQFD